MCQTAITLTTNALPAVTNAEALLKIKPIVGLFIQTMEVGTLFLIRCDRKLTELQSWGYSISMMNSLQLTLFHKYAELLKRRFSEDFQEVIAPCFAPMVSADPHQDSIYGRLHAHDDQHPRGLRKGSQRKLDYPGTEPRGTHVRCSLPPPKQVTWYLTLSQVSMRTALLADVPTVLHRH